VLWPLDGLFAASADRWTADAAGIRRRWVFGRAPVVLLGGIPNRTLPPDRRVDPVPRRCSNEHIEAAAAVVPVLERRGLDIDVAEACDPLASGRGHGHARLDGRD
jgi:hypothetical protein